MRAVDIITKKRDKQTLTKEEIEFFIANYAKETIPDYQASAFLMACFLNGLTFEETGFLTRAMIASGKTMSFKMDKPLVDKHSTGGVGDKISLPLAPLAAAMGLAVPMMSGRALGITGGTLDKLESMAGYRVLLSDKEFEEGIQANGYAMTGQTQDIVPADRLLYALRDVTATVENVSLITASILSKKFAEGADALVFDVKCGQGAFMKSQEQAEALANSLVKTAQSLGRKAVALITRMDEPLGAMTGNFLEVEESIRCLEGQGPEDIMELVYRQAGYMALAGGIVCHIDEGVALAKTKIADGSALKIWWANVKRQGGNPDLIKNQLGKRRGEFKAEIVATQEGYIEQIDALIIGQSGVLLGVGRNEKTDPIDADAGFHFLKKKGDKVAKGEVVAYVYASDKNRLKNGLKLAQTAYRYGNKAPVSSSLIIKEINFL